ncbi:MAG: C1 family peptidase [Clostridia bacterium]|nr:C1 family peptidase [Clostridia bacterium]
MKKFMVYSFTFVLFAVFAAAAFWLGAMQDLRLLEDNLQTPAEQLKEENELIPLADEEQIVFSESYFYGMEKAFADLPDRYKMDEYSLFTVENQSSLGMCWSYASTKVLETFIAKNFNEYYNFSEAWTSVTTKIDWPGYTVSGGGNWYLFVYGINERGLMLEADFPYEYAYNLGENNYMEFYEAYKDLADTSLITDLKFKSIADYNGSLVSPEERTNRINYLKKYVQNFGSIYCSINAGDIKTNYNDNTYYIGNVTPTYSNHAISIIGWDDNYTAGGLTGAWICHNSWGGSYTPIYVMYDDAMVSRGCGFIDEICYNGHLIDVSNWMDDLLGYDKIILESSNSNFIDYNIVDNSELAKNLFSYTENPEFFNSLTYSYKNPIYDNALIDIKVSNAGGDITENFDFEFQLENRKFTITSRNAGLNHGTYKVHIVVDYDGDGTIDEENKKCFVIISGGELGHVYSQFNDAKMALMHNYNSFNLSSGKVNIMGYSKVSYVNFNIHFPLNSKIASFEVESEYSYYSNKSPIYATKNTYARGYLNLYTYTYKEGFTNATLKITTIDGYTFDYEIIIYTFAKNDNVKFVSANYILNGGVNDENNNRTIYINENSKGTHGKVYINEPSKEGYNFTGWYFDGDFTKKISQDENGYYITYNDVKDKINGQNYVNNNNRNYVMLYAEWERSLEYFEQPQVMTEGGSVTGIVENGRIRFTVKADVNFELDFVTLNDEIFSKDEILYKKYGITEFYTDNPELIIRIYFKELTYRLTLVGENECGFLRFEGYDADVRTLVLKPAQQVLVKSIASFRFVPAGWGFQGTCHKFENELNLAGGQVLLTAKERGYESGEMKVAGLFNEKNRDDYAEIRKPIIYDLNGGQFPENANNPYYFTKNTTNFRITNPVKPGYKFAGWSYSNFMSHYVHISEISAKENKGEKVRIISIRKDFYGNLWLTANWVKENSFTK